MRDGLRIISILVMVITLVVASLGVSQARAMAPAVDQMVLCAGNGAVAIHIDASGKPTSHLSIARNVRLRWLLWFHRSRLSCAASIMARALSELTVGNTTLCAM